jgi:hypothetical protein
MTVSRWVGQSVWRNAYELHGRGIEVRFRAGATDFLVSKKSTRFGEPNQAPFQRLCEALSPGVKHMGRGTDHMLSFSAVFKNTWI